MHTWEKSYINNYLLRLQDHQTNYCIFYYYYYYLCLLVVLRSQISPDSCLYTTSIRHLQCLYGRFSRLFLDRIYTFILFSYSPPRQRRGYIFLMSVFPSDYEIVWRHIYEGRLKSSEPAQKAGAAESWNLVCIKSKQLSEDDFYTFIFIFRNLEIPDF